MTTVQHTQEHSAGNLSLTIRMDPTVPQGTTIATNFSQNTSNTEAADVYRTALVAIYSMVLVSGTISLSLMMYILKSSARSTTSIAVLNLVFAHFIFLGTVPFRIYYYVTDSWSLGYGWCKTVSGMIHIHMIMSFVFYVIILITRLMNFYQRGERLACFRSTHALLVSAVVWILVLLVVPCFIGFFYGKTPEENSTELKVCFKFGKHLEYGTTKVFNYIISLLIIVVTTALTATQAKVVWVLYGSHREGRTTMQDFSAQLNSFCFALIVVVCFIPYHVFRLYYLEHIHLQGVNEVFLALTTFNCLDMLTFLRKRTCNTCCL